MWLKFGKMFFTTLENVSIHDTEQPYSLSCYMSVFTVYRFNVMIFPTQKSYISRRKGDKTGCYSANELKHVKKNNYMVSLMCSVTV